MTVLFSVYVVLWVTSFVDSGLLESEDTSKDLYQNIMLISLVGAMLITPFAGYIIDKIHWSVSIRCAFTLRCCTGGLFLLIDDPRGNFALIICSLYLVATVFSNTAIETGYLQGIPSEIRGTMLGLFWVFAFSGIVLFTIAAGYLHDSIGPVAPFEFVLSLDGIYLLILILMGLCGKFK